MAGTKKGSTGRVNAVVQLLRQRASKRMSLSVLVAVVVIGGGCTIGIWHCGAIQSKAEQLGAAVAPLAQMVTEVQLAHTRETAALNQAYHQAASLEQDKSAAPVDEWRSAIGLFRQLAASTKRTLADVERLDRSANKLWLDYKTQIKPLSELRLQHERFIHHAETAARLVEEQRWSELPEAKSEVERRKLLVGHAIHKLLVRARGAETEMSDATRSHQSILLWNTIVLSFLSGGALAFVVATSGIQLAWPRLSGAANKSPATRLSNSPSHETKAPPAKDQTSDEPLPLPLEGRRILVADDGPANQRLLASILKKAGAEVTLASHGHQAIDCVNQSKINGTGFDAILMDLDMPMLDGLGATARLREDGCVTPIFAVTASEFKASREECLSSGFDGFFVKPVAKNELIAAICQHIEQKEPQASDATC